MRAWPSRGKRPHRGPPRHHLPPPTREVETGAGGRNVKDFLDLLRDLLREKYLLHRRVIKTLLDLLRGRI